MYIFFTNLQTNIHFSYLFLTIFQMNKTISTNTIHIKFIFIHKSKLLLLLFSLLFGCFFFWRELASRITDYNSFFFLFFLRKWLAFFRFFSQKLFEIQVTPKIKYKKKVIPVFFNDSSQASQPTGQLVSQSVIIIFNFH